MIELATAYQDALDHERSLLTQRPFTTKSHNEYLKAKAARIQAERDYLEAEETAIEPLLKVVK